MYSQATIPVLISKSKNVALANIVAVFAGVLLIALLAQVALPLPWTPVPITGQTFAVSLVSLLWGYKRAGVVLFLYVLLGTLGAPVFASATSTFLLGPTFGYLIGMFFASIVVGLIVDTGFTNSFIKTLAAAYVGSLIIFSFGLIGLSFFVPIEAIFSMGLIPFLPGDTIKNVLAASVAYRTRQHLNG